jgi:hypothetical protein
LLAVLAVGVDADVVRILRSKQVHCVGDHHRAFIKMMFVLAVGLANTVRRR